MFNIWWKSDKKYNCIIYYIFNNTFSDHNLDMEYKATYQNILSTYFCLSNNHTYFLLKMWK